MSRTGDDMSQFLMKLLLVEFIIIAAFCGFERHWMPMLYYLGAGVIQIAVIGGMK
jgi:hypothetical protein